MLSFKHSDLFHVLRVHRLIFIEKKAFLETTQSVDPEHLEMVRKFKAEHEASKAKLQELQKMVDEKRTTDELVKLEK